MQHGMFIPPSPSTSEQFYTSKFVSGIERTYVNKELKYDEIQVKVAQFNHILIFQVIIYGNFWDSGLQLIKSFISVSCGLAEVLTLYRLL